MNNNNQFSLAHLFWSYPGLTVTTTMAIHWEEPVISDFLLNFNFRNKKIFVNLNFVMDR